VDEHPLVFPNILRHGNDTQIRVPIDDTHTQVFFVHFVPNPDGSLTEEDESVLPVTYFEHYKAPVSELHPFTHFTMHDVQPQDHMAWETQGPIATRANERLATADRGIVMLRELLKRQIEKVQAGIEPINVYRDPDRPTVDTNHSVQMGEWAEINRGRGRAPAGAIQN
jgi:5,5'-dehydrodivanillate O-demethylase